MENSSALKIYNKEFIKL